MTPTDDDLLSKANALIRRSKTGGSDTDSDEAPLLVDALEDLPELTDEFDQTSTQIFPPPFIPPIAVAPTDAPKAQIDKEEEPAPIVEPLNIPHIETSAPPPSAEYVTNEALSSSLGSAATQMVLGFTQEQLDEAVDKAVDVAVANALAEAVPAAVDEAVGNAVTQALEKSRMDVVEHLLNMDAYLAQSLSEWIDAEIPHIIRGELDGMSERIRAKTTAHMHATLLPKLSEKLTEILEKYTTDTPN